MAEKILMNKNTLASLKKELGEYNTALPVFEMKEQQLKEEVRIVENNIKRLHGAINALNDEVKKWVAVMAEDTVDLNELINLEKVISSTQEIVGVTITVVEDIVFKDLEIDRFSTPLWIDAAIEVIRDQKVNHILKKMEEQNLELLNEERAEARRMKNALKEVFIPEAEQNIRKIEIYLGDIERLAIGCAKLVKKKKEEKKSMV